MNILCFHQDWFVEHWRSSGHKVVTCGYYDHLDLRIPNSFVPLSEVLKQLPEQPDLIIYFDNSSAINIVGLEDAQALTIYYAVDCHHHSDWQSYIARIFDVCLVAQKDFLATFSQKQSDSHWLPLWAPHYLNSCNEKIYDVVFVGTLDETLNKDRVDFFNRLSELSPIMVTSGDYTSIFPRSRIVVNQSVNGEVNFRVFEATMSGALLLTENIQHGLPDLFNIDQEIAVYERGKPESAAEQIHKWLAKPQQLDRSALAGRERVLAAHTESHRGHQLLDTVSHKNPSRRKKSKFAAMLNFTIWSRIQERRSHQEVAKGYQLALEALNQAIEVGEPIDMRLAQFSLYACRGGERTGLTKEVATVRAMLAESYPACPLADIEAMLGN